MTLIQNIIQHGINGAGPLVSAKALANEYRATYPSVERALDQLIKTEGRKSFGSGFVTGLGGFALLPVTLPSGMYASWVVQARLIAAIAELCGLDSNSNEVQTIVLLAMIGDGVKEVFKELGIKVGQNVTKAVIKKIPGKVLIEINKKVGMRLLTKSGEKGLINLSKAIPLVGGLIGGGVDCYATRFAGRKAKELFYQPTSSGSSSTQGDQLALA